jgi:hypothetical protein
MNPVHHQNDPASPLDQPRSAVMRQLARVRRGVRAHLAIEGLFWLALVMVGLAALSLSADLAVRFELSTRVALVALGACLLVALALARLIRPQLLRLDDLDLAAVLDRRRPGVGEKMANVLQLPELTRDAALASPSLVAAAVSEQAAALAQVDVSAALNTPRRRWLSAGVVALAAAVVVAALAAPATAGLWMRRWLLGSDARWPQRTYLSIVGLEDRNHLVAPRGEPVVLQVNAQPRFQADGALWVLSGRGTPLTIESPQPPQSEVPDQISIRYRTAAGQPQRDHFKHYSGADFRFELPPLVEAVEFDLRGGDDWLGPIRIEPIDRPAVRRLVVEARAPGSSRSTSLVVGESDAPLQFLATTQLRMRLETSEPVEVAELLVKDRPPLPMPAAQGESEGRNFSFDWKMDEGQTFEIRLVGRHTGLTSKPYFISLGLLQDREPKVTVRATGVGRRVTPQARIPLAVRATDDFGLGRMATELEQIVIKDQKPQPAPPQELDSESLTADPGGEFPLEVERAPTVPLAELGLLPGTAIRLRSKAVDRSPLGARTGNSRWLSFQVVTPEELFYEILMRQREQRAKFAAALAAARTLQESLGAVTASQEVPPLARGHQLVVRQVWQVANQLEATLQEMTLNDLGSPQARELLATSIIQPMRALHDDQMGKQRAALDVLAAAAEPAGPPLDDAQRLQGEVVERMQTILSQMSQWESFVDVVNQLRQVIKLQNQVLESTEKSDRSRTEDVFDK